MSDEELVQCPNNPNHQVPRSQIDEHVKTCKFFINPHHETQITLSSYDEPRPSTSYQESSQEGSSQQGGSQEATLPVPESTSFREWRSQKKPEIQETSPSKLKRLKPYPKPLKSKEISAKSVRASSKLDLSSDKQSKKGLLEMRKKTYLKILSRKRKDLKKLKIDSNSDDTSSSSTDSALSLEDTMSDNKKIILYEMGLEYKEQTPSTSQQTHSSQQTASSQQVAILQPPKLTLEKKDEKMDEESSVDPSSRLSPEPSDPLKLEIEGPSLPGDVPQEQSESVSSYADTSDDSIDLQRLSRKRKMEHEKMDTEEIVEVKVSHLLAEVTTPLEVELEESSSSEEVPLQQSQPFSFHAALSYHSDVSDQPKMISKKKREEMDTEENIVTETSHTLSEVATQLEVEMEEPSLVADVPQQQLQSVSSPAEAQQHSDHSQQLKMAEEKIPEKIDTEEDKKDEASPTLSEVITQLEVELEEPSFVEEVPLQQLQSVSSPSETKQDSDRSQQPMTTTEKKQEKMDADKKIVAEASHTSSEVTTQLEVELEEPSFVEEVPLQQLQPFSFHAASTSDSDVSQQQKMISKKKHEEMDTEEKIEAETSHTLSEVITPLEVELEEPSFVEVVPLQQSQPISFQATLTYHSDISDQPKMISEKKHEEMDSDKKIVAEASHTSSEVTTQLEVELAEPTFVEEVPLQQLQPFSFHAASTSDSDVSQQQKMISKEKHEEIDTEEKIEAETSHTLSEVTTQSEVGLAEPSSVPKEQSKPVSSPAGKTQESVGSERQSRSRKKKHEELMETDSVRPRHRSKSFKQRYSRINIEEKKGAEKSHLSSEEPTPLEVETEEPSLSTDVPEVLVSYHGETICDTSSSDSHKSPQVDFSQQAKPIVDVPQVASMLKKRSHESSEESTDADIGDLPKPGSSPKSYSSSETDSSQRKRKCLDIRTLSGSSSTTDEDKGEKIGLEKPSSSASEKQSKSVVSRGKTKHQLDVPQVAGRLRKRSYEMSDTKLVSLDDPGCSYQTRSSPETDSSPNKIKKRSDSSSTDEYKDEKKGI